MPSTSARMRESNPIARSISPLRSSGAESSGSAMISDSSTPGCSARKAAIASGISDAAADSKAASRRRPPRRPAIASSSASASAEAGEDRVGVADERLAGLGQADAARVALDERAAGLALERGDLLRDGGLREGEGLGGGAERAADRDLSEHAHAADVKHQHNLYHRQQKVI